MIAFFWLANSVTLILGLCLAYIYSAPEDLQRAGSSVSALAALFVVWQVWVEVRFQREIAKETKIEFSAWETLSPLQQKALAMESQQALEKEHNRLIERMKLVVSVALWAFFGEILHGFGDLIAKSLFSAG